MIEEAVSHTPLEAVFAKELDRLSEEVLRLNKQTIPILHEGLSYNDGGRSY